MNLKKTKKLTTIGMLCTLAYAAAAFGRVPLILFLKYDPKDVVIVIGGLLYGPGASLAITLIVSLVQMFTISGTGILGCLMNVLSSCSFACTAAFLYQKKRKLSGAVGGLVCGLGCQVAVMMLWNYLLAPVYMGYPRQAVVKLLLPAFLPFNLIKGGLNAALTLLLYKPVVLALRRCGLVAITAREAESAPAALRDDTSRIPVSENTAPQRLNSRKMQFHPGVTLAALAVIVTCILFILCLNGVF